MSRDTNEKPLEERLYTELTFDELMELKRRTDKKELDTHISNVVSIGITGIVSTFVYAMTRFALSRVRQFRSPTEARLRVERVRVSLINRFIASQGEQGLNIPSKLLEKIQTFGADAVLKESMNIINFDKKNIGIRATLRLLEVLKELLDEIGLEGTLSLSYAWYYWKHIIALSTSLSFTALEKIYPFIAPLLEFMNFLHEDQLSKSPILIRGKEVKLLSVVGKAWIEELSKKWQMHLATGGGDDGISPMEFHLVSPESYSNFLSSLGEDPSLFNTYNFAGPGTNLQMRQTDVIGDDGYPVPKPWSVPINKLDNGARIHDNDYHRSVTFEDVRNADQKLIDVATEIINDPGAGELMKDDARFVIRVFESMKALQGSNFDRFDSPSVPYIEPEVKKQQEIREEILGERIPVDMDKFLLNTFTEVSKVLKKDDPLLQKLEVMAVPFIDNMSPEEIEEIETGTPTFDVQSSTFVPTQSPSFVSPPTASPDSEMFKDVLELVQNTNPDIETPIIRQRAQEIIDGKTSTIRISGFVTPSRTISPTPTIMPTLKPNVTGQSDIRGFSSFNTPPPPPPIKPPPSTVRTVRPDKNTKFKSARNETDTPFNSKEKVTIDASPLIFDWLSPKDETKADRRKKLKKLIKEAKMRLRGMPIKLKTVEQRLKQRFY